MDEIDKLLPSFRACMATEVLKHRGVKGINQIPAFVNDINTHRDRYKAKLDRLRGSTNAISRCNAVRDRSTKSLTTKSTSLAPRGV